LYRDSSRRGAAPRRSRSDCQESAAYNTAVRIPTGELILTTTRSLLLLLFVTFQTVDASAQIDARMLRYPAVSRDQIAFVYAGDVWLVA
jgi:hypothetical protein